MSGPELTTWAELLDGYTIAATDAGLRESTIRVHREHCYDLMRVTRRAPNALDPATLRAWLSTTASRGATNSKTEESRLRR